MNTGVEARGVDARVPEAPRHAVPRSRVSDALDRCAGARIVVVSGYAGTGKTVAVADWVRARRPSATWITIGRAQNDVTAFRRDVVTWLDRAEPTTTVVLDDLDLLTDPLVLETLDAVLERVPAAGQVVLVSRGRPRLSCIARLRARDDVRWLDDGALRFDISEAAALMAQLGVSLPPSDIEAIVATNDGWATGVELAGAAARDGRSATDDAHEYLRTEVLERVPRSTRAFMLECSIADSLAPELCELLTGRRDSAALLDELHRSGAFVSGPEANGAYRFHPALRALLQFEMRQWQPMAFRARHRAAAAWCIRTHDDAGAHRHLLAAGDDAAAWTRLGDALLGQLFGARPPEVPGWAATLPPRADGLDTRAKLGVAVALAYAGRMSEASTWLAHVKQGMGNDAPDELLTARIAFVEYAVTYGRGDLLGAARLGRAARALLDEVAPGEWERRRGPIGRIQLLTLLGRCERARRAHFECGAALEYRSVADDATLAALRADIELAEGNLTRAWEFATEAAAVEASVGLVGIESAYVLGSVLAERNELDAAARHLAAAVARADATGCAPRRVVPLLALARVQHALGDVAQSERSVSLAMECFDDAVVLDQRVTETQALLAIDAGDAAAARRAIFRLAEPCRSRCQARLHARAGDTDLALAALDRVSSGTTRERIQSLLVRARVSASESARAALLREALQLAEVDGYLRVFVNEGLWVVDALENLTADWPNEFPARILAAIAAAIAADGQRARGDEGEGLTPREAEVLRYLATSLAMRDIAGTLFISRNTLKSHVRSIYSKLGVRSRQEAVAWPQQRNSLKAHA